MDKIGISSVFAFRPHVEHLAYLAGLLEDQNYIVEGFDCTASVSSCYPRNLRKGSKLKECTKCLIGGIRSFGIPVTGSVCVDDAMELNESRLRQLTVSSVATALRTESPADIETGEFQRMQENLFPAMRSTYGSARKWIRERQLTGVIFFNGRMDLTAALRVACEDEGVPFIATERAWLGHGISMMPNGNCLDISPISRLCKEFIDKPLTGAQAQLAGKIAAERYLRSNKFEWRLYNKDEIRTEWPGSDDGPRILVVPSSRNEFEGHQERMCPWTDYTEAMSEALRLLDAKPTNTVLRCHPNWSEKIGLRTGEKSETHYTLWAQRKGFCVVPAADTRSTYDLIRQADIILVNGSSSGVEAGILGKKIVSVGHCTYEAAGFSVQIHKPSEFCRLADLQNHSSEETVRRTLRFIYLHAKRLTQFVNFVRAESTTRCRYVKGGRASRIMEIFRTGVLSADDASYDLNSSVAEDRIIAKMINEDWQELVSYEECLYAAPERRVKRQFLLRWLDQVRDRMLRGDR